MSPVYKVGHNELFLETKGRMKLISPNEHAYFRLHLLPLESGECYINKHVPETKLNFF